MTSQTTVEHLGDSATQATVDQYERAVQSARALILLDTSYTPSDEALESGTENQELDDVARAYVWNDGEFNVRIRELLDEEVTF